MSWVDVDISKFTYISGDEILKAFYEESLLEPAGTTDDFLKLEPTDAYKLRKQNLEISEISETSIEPIIVKVEKEISDDTIEEKHE